MVDTVELRHLRYFLAVAEARSVTGAARQLRLAQPSLSRQLHDLEDELGISLFVRTSRGVRLTPAGTAFIDEARAVLRRAEEAVAVARAFSGNASRVLEVGYAPSLAVEILPRALRAFNEAHPDVRVKLHDLSTVEMLDGLRGGPLQVALMIRPPARQLAGLSFHELRRYPICLAVHPGHPLAGGSGVSLRRLRDERLIGYTRAEYPEYHQWLKHLLRGLDRPPVVAEEHDSSTSLIAAVEAGRGVALVPESFRCFAGPRLVLRRLASSAPPFSVGVAHRPGREPAAVQSFVRAAADQPPNSLEPPVRRGRPRPK